MPTPNFNPTVTRIHMIHMRTPCEQHVLRTVNMHPQTDNKRNIHTSRRHMRATCRQFATRGHMRTTYGHVSRDIVGAMTSSFGRLHGNRCGLEHNGISFKLTWKWENFHVHWQFGTSIRAVIHSSVHRFMIETSSDKSAEVVTFKIRRHYYASMRSPDICQKMVWRWFACVERSIRRWSFLVTPRTHACHPPGFWSILDPFLID